MSLWEGDPRLGVHREKQRTQPGSVPEEPAWAEGEGETLSAKYPERTRRDTETSGFRGSVAGMNWM